MPSWDRYEKQPKDYKDSVIPKYVKVRLGIEMGASLGWNKYIGDYGDVLAIDQFGASVPGDKIIEEYGFTVENVISKFKKLF
jgi:transketolase